MEECSLEFLLVRDSPFGFLVGAVVILFQQLKLDFFRQIEDSILLP